MHSIVNIGYGSAREKGLISSKCLYLCIFSNLSKKKRVDVSESFYLMKLYMLFP